MNRKQLPNATSFKKTGLNLIPTWVLIIKLVKTGFLPPHFLGLLKNFASNKISLKFSKKGYSNEKSLTGHVDFLKKMFFFEFLWNDEKKRALFGNPKSGVKKPALANFIISTQVGIRFNPVFLNDVAFGSCFRFTNHHPFQNFLVEPFKLQAKTRLN